jgi:hypothetical protein
LVPFGGSLSRTGIDDMVSVWAFLALLVVASAQIPQQARLVLRVESSLLNATTALNSWSDISVGVDFAEAEPFARFWGVPSAVGPQQCVDVLVLRIFLCESVREVR